MQTPRCCANKILRKASAYLAQAELDRRPKQGLGKSATGCGAAGADPTGVRGEFCTVYGVRKVWQQLGREGTVVARCAVARPMPPAEAEQRTTQLKELALAA